MFVVAVVLSVVLFVSFASAGAQKIVFNPAMSKSAEHLGFTKRGFQRVGFVELLGALAVLAGLVASRGSALGVLNEIAAAALTVMMGLAVRVHLRRGDATKYITPALVLGVMALVEVICRLA
jgi:uncharacterized membrane protein YphA (DoxX/SURF4 family)